jgi:hypothetical protein
VKKFTAILGLFLALAAGGAHAQRNELSAYGAWNSLSSGGQSYDLTILNVAYGYYFNQQLVGTLGVTRIDSDNGNGGGSADYTSLEAGVKFYFGPPKQGNFTPFIDGGIGLWDNKARNSTDTSWRLGVGGAYFITEATSIDPTISYVNIQSSPKTNGHIFGLRLTTRF